MQVILLTDVKKVGQRGSVVSVADGYALNVLIPQKKAVPATPENLKKHEKGVADAKLKADTSATQAREMLSKIDGKTLTIVAKAGPTGTLFKSLHAEDIVAEIKKQWGVDLPTSAVILDHPIKQSGSCRVSIRAQGARSEITLSL